MVIEPTESDMGRYKLVFVYVAATVGASSNDTASPLTIIAVVKIPFRYGASASEIRSWAWVRVNSFVSKFVLF